MGFPCCTLQKKKACFAFPISHFLFLLLSAHSNWQSIVGRLSGLSTLILVVLMSTPSHLMSLRRHSMTRWYILIISLWFSVAKKISVYGMVFYISPRNPKLNTQDSLLLGEVHVGLLKLLLSKSERGCDDVFVPRSSTDCRFLSFLNFVSSLSVPLILVQI